MWQVDPYLPYFFLVTSLELRLRERMLFIGTFEIQYEVKPSALLPLWFKVKPFSSILTLADYYGWQKFVSTDECIFFFFDIWNASQICVSSLCRGHANLLCIVPILVYVLPKWAWVYVFTHSVLGLIKSGAFESWEKTGSLENMASEILLEIKSLAPSESRKIPLRAVDTLGE